MNVEIQITYVLILNHVGFSYVINSVGIGSLVSQGLPNITGNASFGQGMSGSGTAFLRTDSISGAFIASSSGYFGIIDQQINTHDWSRILYLNASRSNTIYGNSQNVTPASIRVGFLIKY